MVVNTEPIRASLVMLGLDGSKLSTITSSLSDSSLFTDTLCRLGHLIPTVRVVAISGNNLIVSPSGPSFSADANTVQNVAIVATQ